MSISLNRPDGLADDTWAAVQGHVDRLERAQRDNDLSLMVGTAKDLVETIAKVVLEIRGQTVASNAKLPTVLTDAHRALERQPGQGAASDLPLRDIAQGAKTIIAQLPGLRNRTGTGHGRVLPPEVDEEVVPLCIDAALLWSRWALRRLGRILAGMPDSLVTALQGSVFYRGVLAERLQALSLPTLEPAEQRLVGVAVAHRAMGNTFLAWQEGVDACAQQPDLSIWPADYRAGLVEGLLLDRVGYVDTVPAAVTAAAAIIAPHPSAENFLQELSAKISQASWAYSFASDPSVRQSVVEAMVHATAVLPTEPVRVAWRQIIQRFQPDQSG